MKFVKLLAPVLLALTLAASGAYAAATTIKVQLADVGGTMDTSKNMGLGIGMGGDMKKATMSIVINKKTVKAGRVTFDVTNISKETIHELIVSPIASENETLPYLNDENRVDEEHGSHLGEVAELEPGKSGALTVTLKPGMYVLYCNIPNHYMAGMWTLLTVTK